VCILLRITLVTSGHLRECEWKTSGVSLRQDLDGANRDRNVLKEMGLLRRP
jgi:hypothetical protein